MSKAERPPRTLSAIEQRKNAHLELCARQPVEHTGKSTLLEEVELVHDALPELALDEVDTSVEFLGKRLRAPFLITGMTGGTAEAFAVNRDLATIAEEFGIGFGLGSQRAMETHPETAWTYQVRSFAPSALLLANIGLTQAARQPSAAIEALVTSVGADALCVHLNPAQELIQPEGDRDFRHGLETFARLARDCPVPVVAKETGCGISPAVARRLLQVGVTVIDVSGAGGTSWVKVESLRTTGSSRRLGETFSDWGIPTAAALCALRDSGAQLIASGGLRTGLEIAKCLALGATVCGAALPVFRAYREGQKPAAARLVAELILGLKTAMLLSGARTVAELRTKPVVLGPRLQSWVEVLRATTS